MAAILTFCLQVYVHTTLTSTKKKNICAQSSTYYVYKLKTFFRHTFCRTPIVEFDTAKVRPYRLINRRNLNKQKEQQKKEVEG